MHTLETLEAQEEDIVNVKGVNVVLTPRESVETRKMDA
jgi:hypothetical protein